MVKLFICKICGEPYLGREKPTECAFCGAAQNFIGVIEDYSTLWEVELSDQEKQDMQKTLELELNAVAYYDKVSKTQPKYSKYNRLYKQLTRVEQEHLDIAVKFLKTQMPEIKGEDSKGSIEADLKRTKELEEGAVGFYKQFAQNATNEKVKTLYASLIAIEQSHVDFVNADMQE